MIETLALYLLVNTGTTLVTEISLLFFFFIGILLALFLSKLRWDIEYQISVILVYMFFFLFIPAITVSKQANILTTCDIEYIQIPNKELKLEVCKVKTNYYKDDFRTYVKILEN